MPAILVAIWNAVAGFWAALVEMIPWLGKLVPWLVGLCPMLLSFLRKVMSWIGADTVEGVLKGAAAMAVRIAVLTAWGVFLAVVFSGIYGFGIREICFQNPFSGFPQAMMFLVAAAFPIKWGLSLVTSYILWRFTVNQAALIMSRTVKFLFGA